MTTIFWRDYMGWMQLFSDGELDSDDVMTLCITLDADRAEACRRWLLDQGVYQVIDYGDEGAEDEVAMGLKCWYFRQDICPLPVYQALVKRFGKPLDHCEYRKALRQLA